MSYLIDAIIVVRELLLLCFVVITSPMAFVAGALMFGSTEY
jgi:hypothetical protein